MSRSGPQFITVRPCLSECKVGRRLCRRDSFRHHCIPSSLSRHLGLKYRTREPMLVRRAICRPPVFARSFSKTSALPPFRSSIVKRGIACTQARTVNKTPSFFAKPSSRIVSLPPVKKFFATSATMSADSPRHSGEVDLGNYEVLSEFSLEYAPVTVTKYRSKKTGFQVVVGNHKGKCVCCHTNFDTQESSSFSTDRESRSGGCHGASNSCSRSYHRQTRTSSLLPRSLTTLADRTRSNTSFSSARNLTLTRVSSTVSPTGLEAMEQTHGQQMITRHIPSVPLDRKASSICCPSTWNISFIRPSPKRASLPRFIILTARAKKQVSSCLKCKVSSSSLRES